MSVTIHEQATPCIGRNLKFRKGEGRGEICDFAGTNFSPSFPRANTLPVPSRHLRCLASCAISPPRQLPHKKPAFTERLFHLLRESGFLSRLSTTSCPSLILRRPGCAKCCADSFLQDAARHGRACPAGLMPLSIRRGACGKAGRIHPGKRRDPLADRGKRSRKIDNDEAALWNVPHRQRRIYHKGRTDLKTDSQHGYRQRRGNGSPGIYAGQ